MPGFNVLSPDTKNEEDNIAINARKEVEVISFSLSTDKSINQGPKKGSLSRIRRSRETGGRLL